MSDTAPLVPGTGDYDKTEDYFNPTKRAWTIVGVATLTAIIVAGITLAILFPSGKAKELSHISLTALRKFKLRTVQLSRRC